MKLVLAIICFGVGGHGYADLSSISYGNKKNVLVGSKASLLGGSYSSLSNDTSGLYYNPAGMSFSKQDQSSISIIFSEHHSETIYEKALLGEDITESSTTNFANISGALFQKSWISFGYSVISLDNRNLNQNLSVENQSQDSSLDAYERFNQEFGSYQLYGVGGSVRASNNFSLGFSGFYYQRKMQLSNFQKSQFSNGSINSQFTKVKSTNEGLFLVVGSQLRYETFGVGLAISKNYNKGASNQRTDSTTIINNETGNIQDSTTSISATTYTEPQILNGSLGMHVKLGFLLLSGQVDYHQSDKTSPNYDKFRATSNYSFGIEIDLTYVKFLGAFFTNNSLYKDLEAESTNQNAQIDYVGQSVGLTMNADNFFITFGVINQTGEGKSQIIADDTAIQDVKATISNIFTSIDYEF